MRNPFRVDFGLIASVRLLQQACEELSRTHDEFWWFAAEDPTSIVLAYGDPEHELEVVSFRFPKIAHLDLFGEDGELVCLYPMALEQKSKTLTIEDGRVKVAEDGDYDAFWEPLKTILVREMSQELLREAIHANHV